jgi:MerR HTH family regulatory protein
VAGASQTRATVLYPKGVASPASQVDLLEPVDLSQHLHKLELYLGQVCRIAGISKMQLDYWTNKARIPTKGRKQRIYDMEALETVMLIKQGKDKGLSLAAAIEAARRFQAAERLQEDEFEAQDADVAERSFAAASSGVTVLT